MAPAKRVVLFGVALGTSVAVAVLVLRGHASQALTLAWFASLFAFATATRFRQPPRPGRLQAAALLLLVAALPVVVRAANMDRDRVHGDESLTGYFSATHDFAHTSFFDYMPERWQWLAQFPKPFFFLQRLFFAVFGESVLTMRLSVQIHVAIVSVMLFLIVREIFDSRSALVAVLVYSFFAPSIYLETLGFMFVSSAAALTFFFYFALREYRTGEMFHAATAGIACGLCYLTYYSSYIALPVLVTFFAVQWLRVRSTRVVQNLAIALGGVLVVLLPFLAGGLRSRDHGLFRASQVSLLTGSWSGYRELIEKGELTPLRALRDNLVRSLNSFVLDGVGGGGGYDFGRFALFDRFSLALLVAGGLIGLVLALRNTELLFVFLVVVAAFVGLVVLTIPPPAYHRFSVAFPFLAILMTLPFTLILRLRKIPRSIRYAVVCGLVLVFACVNQRRHVEATLIDPIYEDFRLADLVTQRYPGRNLYVAGDPAHAFQKIFFFRDKSKNRHVETAYHDALLKKFDPHEEYVYVITLADDFRKRFEEADPNGRFVRFSIGYSLFAN